MENLDQEFKKLAKKKKKRQRLITLTIALVAPIAIFASLVLWRTSNQQQQKISQLEQQLQTQAKRTTKVQKK